MTVTPREPGVHDISAHDYHADTDALSSTGARRILPPGTPAAFRYWQQHPGEFTTRALEFGKAAHTVVLGVGPDIVVLPGFWDYRTADARRARDTALAEGKVPLLPAEREALDAMVNALHGHRLARDMLDPLNGGAPERSIYARHKPTGVLLRCRLDWLPEIIPGKRLILWDYKTALSADPDEFAKAAARYGYHVQAAFYRHIAIAAGLGEDVGFCFLVQEKTAPYLCNVIQLDGDAMRAGERIAGDAIRLYAKCLADDDWPGYGDDVTVAQLPMWAL